MKNKLPLPDPEDTDEEPKELPDEEPIEEKDDQEEELTDDDKEEKITRDQEDFPSGDESASTQYYLQTVKVGEQPEFPRPKEELDVFSQPLDGGLIQYYAYPKGSGKTADNLPHAEEIAAKNKAEDAVIIIDQVADHLSLGSCLELILARHSHALAKTDSNLDNLEANITSLLDLSRQTFGMNVEHFMSTSNVSPEVEKRLDDLEEAETGEENNPPKEYNREQRDTKMEENNQPLYFADRSAVPSENKRSKMFTLIPILVVILVFAAVVYFRESLLATVKNQINPPKPVAVETTPTPSISPIPTPAITVDRSNFKVRVLNGTPKTGAAGVLADQLKEKGWQIDRTGNATSSAIAESSVRGKLGMTDAISVLIADVSDYQGSSSSSSLKSSDKADLEFVIGKK